MPFTSAWANALCGVVNADERYRAATSGWNRPVARMLSTVGLRGYPEDAAVELHLDQGDSRSARAMSAGEVTAPFILRADYVTWKEMALGELDPRISVTRPRVAFTGKLATPLLHADATRAMVARAQRVPTRFT